jgi:hypothetical protein
MQTNTNNVNKTRALLQISSIYKNYDFYLDTAINWSYHFLSITSATLDITRQLYQVNIANKIHNFSLPAKTENIADHHNN